MSNTLKYVLIIVGIGFVLGWFKFSGRGRGFRRAYRSGRRQGAGRMRSIKFGLWRGNNWR